ncbi:MAG: tetratricopeptide repeat protein [Pseudomonas sp.]|uniref:tetratricopeptide repeat protein n=1 Tax=Pseudomonas sp. TaxID=306 RepID=UPI0033972640
MPILALLVILCQVACGLHVVRSGQERSWLYLIIALPGLGCLIYGLGVMLPEMLGSRNGRRAVSRVQDKLDPERTLRALRDEVSVGDTPQNRALLGDELLRLGRAEEAANQYQQALRGVHAQAPELLLNLARAEFAQGHAGQCRATLERLIEHNPQYRSADGHLLYARALSQVGETSKAEDEFRALIESFAGPEARYHYAQLLMQQGRAVESRQLLEQIEAYARRAPRYYRNLHKPWLALTRQALQDLSRPPSS